MSQRRLVDEVRLQPLRVPPEWVITYNQLYELDPDPTVVDRHHAWMFFGQDMLQINCPGSNLLVDVGWYPQGNLLEGAYGLVVYEGDFCGTLLHEFRTRSRLELVAEVERVLEVVGKHPL